MDKFQHTNDKPKLNQEDINHLNRSKMNNKIKAEIVSPKSSRLDGFTAEFY
jgi:hypothetical protein